MTDEDYNSTLIVIVFNVTFGSLILLKPVKIYPIGLVFNLQNQCGIYFNRVVNSLSNSKRVKMISYFTLGVYVIQI